ncbi:hypothetical protein POPTR_015G074450v4 [Populus trichocarpa]|uniref:Uncharacterized protein n=1 Tax=Populus trichocarpa TaxID=3694 RepID=A0ACC0RVD8_POPTR|nr:hypothetical protein POPTR_015G074450v4 [Populus trichocarpa]
MIGMRHLNSKDGFDFHSIYFVQFFYAVASHLRLLLFQIDDRKDVCLVAVAPPIEKWLSFFFSQLLTYQQFNFVLFFVWWFSSPSFIYY